MPTVMRIDGTRVMIYTHDHGPAHVHVRARGLEAVFLLQCPAGPPMLRENDGFGRRELELYKAAIANAIELLCRAWERIHDQR